jgi:hypothetical protein
MIFLEGIFDDAREGEIKSVCLKIRQHVRDNVCESDLTPLG